MADSHPGKLGLVAQRFGRGLGGKIPRDAAPRAHARRYLSLAGAKKPPKRGLIATAPSIAIEVISPTARDKRRDRVEKLAEYAEFGVRWYWLVDPELRTIEIFELKADGRYRRRVEASDGTIEQVPGCEGLEIALQDLWAEIDRLED